VFQICSLSFHYVANKIKTVGKNMISFIKRTQLTAFIILLGFSVVSIAKEEPTYSGYLGDEIYGKLQEVEIHEGVKAKRWIDPKLNFANY